MTKYNLSKIMSRAHAIRKETNVTMSAALTKAWAEAKNSNALHSMYKDQKAEFVAAFKAKYPTGTIEIGQFWNSAKVRYTADGKEYFYGKTGWQSKLGIKIPA